MEFKVFLSLCWILFVVFHKYKSTRFALTDFPSITTGMQAVRLNTNNTTSVVENITFINVFLLHISKYS